jgi:hypothetical protein
MALEPTQPLTEATTRNLPGGKGRPARNADLAAIYEPIIEKMWELRRLTNLWASMASYMNSFTFTFKFPYADIFVSINVFGAESVGTLVMYVYTIAYLSSYVH